MSVRVCNGVLENGPLDGALRYALFILAHQADDFGFSAAEQSEIAKLMSVSERTVQRNFGDLEDQGWLRIERKVLDGRANVYFINLQKIGVTIGDKPFRHRLWNDLERMRKALHSGDKLSRVQGVMKFEKPADAKGEVVIGDLFPEEESGDNLSGESETNPAGKVAEMVGRPGEYRQTPTKPEPDDKLSSGMHDLSGDTRQKRHLTDDKLSGAFNTSSEVVGVVKDNNPLPPAKQGDVGEDVSDQAKPKLPVAECTFADVGFADSHAVAVAWVADMMGVTKRRFKPLVADQLLGYCRRNRSVTLEEAAALMVRQWRLMLEHEHLLRHAKWSPENFIQGGHWTRPLPYDEAKRRDASVGMNRQEAEQDFDKRKREHALRCARWTAHNAELLRANALPLDDVAERVLWVAGQLEGAMSEDEAEPELVKIEAALMTALAEHSPAAKQKYDEIVAKFEKYPADDRGVKEARHRTLRVQLSNLCDTPYLSLRFMPDDF